MFNNYEYSNDYGSDHASDVCLSGYVQCIPGFEHLIILLAIIVLTKCY